MTLLNLFSEINRNFNIFEKIKNKFNFSFDFLCFL